MTPLAVAVPMMQVAIPAADDWRADADVPAGLRRLAGSTWRVARIGDADCALVHVDELLHLCLPVDVLGAFLLGDHLLDEGAVGDCGRSATPPWRPRRSLLGRRHADRGLGLDEERQAEGRLGRAAGDGGGRNAEADFHGQKRSNETHASTTDPDARLYRKGPGKEAKLCFIGHGLMENRHGLLVDACLTLADGHAERVAALHMIEPRADRPQAITLGADKAYDAEDFVNELRSMKVTPHVAQNTSGRRSAIDGRTTRHGGYAVSQRIRKRIEEAFGWIKTVAGQEKTRFRGRDRVGWAFTFAAAAYNLVRLPKLMAETG